MNSADGSCDSRASEHDIRRLVHTFYGRVQKDELLGPVFAARIGDRWDQHLEKMCDFWSSVLRASGRYRGDPLATHATIPAITSEHFDRWLSLFEEVASETLEPWQAADVSARALRMRAVLERVTPVP